MVSLYNYSRKTGSCPLLLVISIKKMNDKKSAKKPKIQPLGDRVLLRELEEKHSKTDSGIFIPETANADKDAKRGEVVAVGEGRFEEGKRIPPEVKVGDVVLYSWGDKMEIDGVKYVIVREGEISAVIK